MKSSVAEGAFSTPMGDEIKKFWDPRNMGLGDQEPQPATGWYLTVRQSDTGVSKQRYAPEVV